MPDVAPVAPLARNASGILKGFHKFVSEVGPMANLLRVLFRVGEAICRHSANLCEEVAKLTPTSTTQGGGGDAAPSISTEA